jgi:hypothetical protein
MKGNSRLTGLARILGILIAMALLLSLIVPLAGAAQEAEENTIEVLSEMPSTGARRLGPLELAGSRVPAPETPEPEQVEGFTPIELQIDKVGLFAPIETGTIVDGAMQDPSGPWVVAWYDQLGKVGEGHNVVMAGHVDYWNTGPAIFWEVPNLQPGDVIRVVGPNNETMEYAVEWTQMYDVATELTPEVIQRDIVGNTGQESLTLITCGGEFNPETAEYLQRWVVRANLI